MLDVGRKPEPECIQEIGSFTRILGMLKTAETNEKKKTIQKYTQKSSHAFVLVTVHPLGSSKASLIT